MNAFLTAIRQETEKSELGRSRIACLIQTFEETEQSELVSSAWLLLSHIVFLTSPDYAPVLCLSSISHTRTM